MPSRPSRAQAAAAGLGLAVLLTGSARSQPVEIMRGPYPERLMSRAAHFLQARDYPAARAFYEAAARQGVAEAATAVGRTYDPSQTVRQGVPLGGNSELAEQWYRQGVDLGDPAASALLQSIEDRSSNVEKNAALTPEENLDRFMRLLGHANPTAEDRQNATEMLRTLRGH